MIVKNISGFTQVFDFDGEVSVELADDAVATLPDTNEVYAAAYRYATRGVIEIVTNPIQAVAFQSAGAPAHIRLFTTANFSDTETLTVNGVVFEADNNASITAGRTAFTIGASAVLSIDAFAAALLAHADFAGYRYLGASVYATNGAAAAIALPEGVAVADVTVAEGTANFSISVVAAAAGDSFVQFATSRTVATLPNDLVFMTGIGDIVHVVVTVRTAAGAVKAWDGALSWSGGVIVMDNSGTTDVAATDVIFVQAFGTR